MVMNALVDVVRPTGGIGVVGVYVPEGPGASDGRSPPIRVFLGALARTALGGEESRQLIATLATELHADCEDHDNHA